MNLIIFIYFSLVVVNIAENVQKDSKDVGDEAASKLFAEIDNLFIEKKQLDEDLQLNDKLLLSETSREFFPRLMQLNSQNITNNLNRRQLEIIKRAVKYPKVTLEYRQVLRTLKSVGNQRWSCPYNQSNQTNKSCNLAFVPHLKSIITNSQDLEEIKYYWQDWRNKMPTQIKKALLSQLQFYQSMTKDNLTASKIWYEDYETENFHSQLQNIMESLRPLYRELHAHIRNILHVKYGDKVINSTGLIPAHLFESVTYQAWKKDTILVNPFPARRLPNLQNDINGLQFKPFDLIKMSQMYFGYMGFKNMTL